MIACEVGQLEQTVGERDTNVIWAMSVPQVNEKTPKNIQS